VFGSCLSFYLARELTAEILFAIATSSTMRAKIKKARNSSSSSRAESNKVKNALLCVGVVFMAFNYDKIKGIKNEELDDITFQQFLRLYSLFFLL
jgi:hypothetical protein